MRLTRWLGDRDFFAGVVRVGLPVAVQSLLASSLAIIDSIMVGSMGETALAAVGVALQWNSLLFSAYWGLCSGGTLFLAQYWGVDDERGIARAFGLMLLSTMGVTLVFSLTGVLFPTRVMSLYTNEAQIIAQGAVFLRILCVAMLAQSLSSVCSVMLRSTENVRLPLFTGIVSILVNTGLNWVLIYGHLGAPALGLKGSAIATLAASLVNAAILLGASLRFRNALAHAFRYMFGFSRAFIREFFSRCTPIIINEVFYGVALLIINIVLGHQGAHNMSALAIFRTLEGLIFAFFQGFANAASVLVGKQVGAGSLSGAMTDAKRFAVLCPMFTFTVCLVVLLLRLPILSLFNISEGVFNTVTWMLVIYTFTAPLRTANYIQVTSYRAGGESRMGMYLEVGGIWLVGAPLVALMGMVIHAPFLLVFLMLYMEEVVKLPIETRYLLSGRWIKPVTQQGRAALAARDG